MTRKSRPKRKPKPRARKTAISHPLDAALEASASMHGLTIDARWKPAIREHLTVILRHAARVQEFKLPDDAEPAPVFKP